jgi:outer membrane protein OmpA-like peptidoglycan-associated protein
MPPGFRALVCLAVCGVVPAWATDVSDIKPRTGLILTNAVFASVVSSGGNFDYMDTEDLFTLETVAPEGLTYQIKMSAPGNQRLEEVASRLKWPRKVRHEDLEESSRMTLMYASTDPASYAGQTFAETSRKVLTALKTGGETPFVFGPYASANPLGALAQSGNTKPAPAPRRAGGAPLIPDMGQLFHMLFGSARHYYRGTLHRVEPQDVPVAVLVNGVRTNLPAVHAAGSFTFAQEDPVKVEVWWLDNPDWPLTLHYTFGPGSSLVTRIDWQPEGNDSGGGAAGAGSARDMAAKLQSKSCHVELHGVYFNSGSAVLLEESEPMLKQVAALIKASPEAALTIEGHTDNIGSAEYNQALSEHRASAVRDVLVSRYGIAPGRLTAKGYGLTRPVETNASPAGRAHNRRVELARPCAAH